MRALHNATTGSARAPSTSSQLQPPASEYARARMHNTHTSAERTRCHRVHRATTRCLLGRESMGLLCGIGSAGATTSCCQTRKTSDRCAHSLHTILYRVTTSTLYFAHALRPCYSMAMVCETPGSIRSTSNASASTHAHAHG